MKRSLHEMAIRLRQDGWSYNIISKQLLISKSTLSNWLKEVPYFPNPEVIRRIREGPARIAVLKHDEKLRNIALAKSAAIKELSALSRRDLWMLGIGLYIGEGSKLYESIRIINSDPDVIRLAIKWFRRICGLKTKNFTIAIHLYPDTPIKKALQFWSRISEIPLSQFGKTQVDRRLNKSGKKQRKLPYGTAHITIKSIGNFRFGKMLHRRIIGWIEGVYKQI